MNNRKTKTLDNNKAKARAKPGQILLVFFLPYMGQAESQNHNNEIDNPFNYFLFSCHNDFSFAFFAFEQ